MNKIPAKILTTDRQIRTALKLGAQAPADRLYAVGAAYDHRRRRLTIHLSNGVVILVPPQLLQGLENATPEQLVAVQIDELGTGLHWPDLNVDHLVSGLLAGVFGTRRWMDQLSGKKSVLTSPTKQVAQGRQATRSRPRFGATVSR